MQIEKRLRKLEEKRESNLAGMEWRGLSDSELDARIEEEIGVLQDLVGEAEAARIVAEILAEVRSGAPQ